MNVSGSGQDGLSERGHVDNDATHAMTTEPYTALAKGYDFVMAHVDYDAWAAYLFTLLRQHGDEIETVVELGGGTGSLARRLQPLGGYDYILSDGSTPMLEQARRKVDTATRSIRCVNADFTCVSLEDLGLETPVDAVVLVYDGLNYLVEPADVASLFRSVYGLLRPGGIAIIDQSTPANSEEHDSEFVHEGATEDFSYIRHSEYDPETRQHETVFELCVDGEWQRECHLQRAYSVEEVQALLDDSPLRVVRAYDALTTDPVRDDSYRVHWVLRRPT